MQNKTTYFMGAGQNCLLYQVFCYFEFPLYCLVSEGQAMVCEIAVWHNDNQWEEEAKSPLHLIADVILGTFFCIDCILCGMQNIHYVHAFCWVHDWLMHYVAESHVPVCQVLCCVVGKHHSHTLHECYNEFADLQT